MESTLDALSSAIERFSLSPLRPGLEISSLSQAPRIDFRTLFASAAQGGRAAVEVRQRCVEAWAANAVALIHAYDPEMVVMGGGVMRNGVAILPYVQEYVGRHAWAAWGKPQVRSAALGERAGLLGAVPLLEEEF